jgi:hypothetical protein
MTTTVGAATDTFAFASEVDGVPISFASGRRRVGSAESVDTDHSRHRRAQRPLRASGPLPLRQGLCCQAIDLRGHGETAGFTKLGQAGPTA